MSGPNERILRLTHLGSFSFQEEYNQEPQSIVVQHLSWDCNNHSRYDPHEGHLMGINLDDLPNLQKI